METWTDRQHIERLPIRALKALLLVALFLLFLGAPKLPPFAPLPVLGPPAPSGMAAPPPASPDRLGTPADAAPKVGELSVGRRAWQKEVAPGQEGGAPIPDSVLQIPAP